MLGGEPGPGLIGCTGWISFSRPPSLVPTGCGCLCGILSTLWPPLLPLVPLLHVSQKRGENCKEKMQEENKHSSSSLFCDVVNLWTLEIKK